MVSSQFFIKDSRYSQSVSNLKNLRSAPRNMHFGFTFCVHLGRQRSDNFFSYHETGMRKTCPVRLRNSKCPC
jgi:hypothetical protein